MRVHLVIYDNVLIGIGLDAYIEQIPETFARMNYYREWIKKVLLIGKYGEIAH